MPDLDFGEGTTPLTVGESQGTDFGYPDHVNPWRNWPVKQVKRQGVEYVDALIVGLDGTRRRRRVDTFQDLKVDGVPYQRGVARRWDHFGDSRVVYTEPGEAVWLEATEGEREEMAEA